MLLVKEISGTVLCKIVARRLISDMMHVRKVTSFTSYRLFRYWRTRCGTM